MPTGKPMLITANQPFGARKKVFPDPAMALSAVDRLVHHATILEMNVESYRRRQANKRKEPGRPASYATPANSLHRCRPRCPNLPGSVRHQSLIGQCRCCRPAGGDTCLRRARGVLAGRADCRRTSQGLRPWQDGLQSLALPASPRPQAQCSAQWSAVQRMVASERHEAGTREVAKRYRSSDGRYS